MRKPRAIFVLGKKWFSGKGHSYCSATVWIDGEFVGGTDKELPALRGYDLQWEAGAFEILQKAGVFPKNCSPHLWRECEDRGIKLVSECVNVRTRADL